MTWPEDLDGPAAMSRTLRPAASDAEAVRTWHLNVAAARQLLIRTAELPDSKRELLDVLSEYRAALFAFAVGSSKS
jgi:hypothetical protein